jgi:hypothetical protein
MHTPTPLKTTACTSSRTGQYGRLTAKNQLMGTLASIASEPKLTVTSAARSVVEKSSFEPSALLMM